MPWGEDDEFDDEPETDKPLTPDRLDQAVRARQRVKAMHATPQAPFPRAIGRLIAYCEVPSVLIETDSGERIWWRADLVEPFITDDRELTP